MIKRHTAARRERRVGPVWITLLLCESVVAFRMRSVGRWLGIASALDSFHSTRARSASSTSAPRDFIVRKNIRKPRSAPDDLPTSAGEYLHDTIELGAVEGPVNGDGEIADLGIEEEADDLDLPVEEVVGEGEPLEEFDTTGSADRIDDPVRIYLMQMGEIPLLNRDQEVEAAKRIELTRTRYRRSLLSSDYILQAAVSLIKKVRDGELRLDRTVDVSVTDAAEKKQIMAMHGSEPEDARSSAAKEPPRFFHRHQQEPPSHGAGGGLASAGVASPAGRATGGGTQPAHPAPAAAVSKSCMKFRGAWWSLLGADCRS